MARAIRGPVAVRQEAADATIAAVAQKVTFGGATTAFLGGVSANSIAAIGGLIVAVIGLVVTVYYKHRADQRAEDRHKVQMRKLMGMDEDEEA